jgi:hypothetical protein
MTLVGHSHLKLAPGKRTFTGTSGFDPEQPFISPFRCSIADLRGNQR